MSLRIIQHGLLCVAAALVLSCSHQGQLAAGSSDVTALQQWQLQAKVALRSNDGGHTANLSWTQDDDKYQLSFYGPLGAGRVELKGDSNKASLNDGKAIHHASSASALLYDVTGLSMPVEMLRWWVRGLPDPSFPVQSIERVDGRLHSFKQGGWTLEIQRYQQYDQLTLPNKLKANNDAYSVKLIIHEWRDL